jgi:hypothetical protein
VRQAKQAIPQWSTHTAHVCIVPTTKCNGIESFLYYDNNQTKYLINRCIVCQNKKDALPYVCLVFHSSDSGRPPSTNQCVYIQLKINRNEQLHLVPPTTVDNKDDDVPRPTPLLLSRHVQPTNVYLIYIYIYIDVYQSPPLEGGEALIMPIPEE